MAELSVTVRAPGTVPKTYVFPQGPITIGRSPDCSISICHEAVSRKLCTAWVEENSSKVRVEERPGLTNPLMMGTSPVVGGVCKERVVLTVGPVVVELSAGGSRESVDGLASVPGSPRRALLIGATALVCLLAIAVFASRGEPPSPIALDLPDTPFAASPPPDEAEGPAFAPLERAQILYTRAQHLLQVRNPDAMRKVRAADLVLRSAALLEAAGEVDAALERKRKAATIRRETEEEYRRSVVDLRRSLERNDESAGIHAGRVLAFLDGVEFGSRAMLEALAASKEEIRR